MPFPRFPLLFFAALSIPEQLEPLLPVYSQFGFFTRLQKSLVYRLVYELDRTRQIIETWRKEYNGSWPHSVLGKKTSDEIVNEAATSHVLLGLQADEKSLSEQGEKQGRPKKMRDADECGGGSDLCWGPITAFGIEEVSPCLLSTR